jgi:hypothetical protein
MYIVSPLLYIIESEGDDIVITGLSVSELEEWSWSSSFLQALMVKRLKRAIP